MSEPEIPAQQRMIMDAFRLWLTPEVERRQALKLIPKSYELKQAQVLFPDDGEAIIRLNEEVKGEMRLRRTQGVELGAL